MPLLDFSNVSQSNYGDLNGSSFSTLKDVNGNNLSKKHREKIDTTSQGALLVSGKNDDWATIIRTDRKGNQIYGNYIPEIIESFEGATVNVQKWATTNTTFVPAQSTASGYVMNNTSLTTANAVAILQSQYYIKKLPRVPLQLKARIRANIPTNATADFGFGIPTTTTLMTPNGVSIRIVNGLWYVAVTSNGAETVVNTAIVDYATGLTQLNTANSNSEYYVVDLIIDDDNAIVTVQNTQTGVMVGYCSVQVPLSSLKMFAATALPVYFRLFNAASAPATAPNLTIGELQVLSTDWALQPDMSQIAASLSLSSGRHPFTGAQLENHTNSTAPVSATLSNTTAGYTTLGGKWQFAAVAGSTTDYCLFGFQVPANSRFLCEGIRIDTRNTGAAVATTATTLEWSMGFNSSAVSLATANIIRKQVGHQSFPIGSSIEAVATSIDIDFKVPEVTESGRYVQVILTLPVGTATASQIIRGLCTIKGRFI